MSVEINTIPNLPVIVLRAVNPIRLPNDPELFLHAVVNFKQITGKHVFRLFDASTSDWMVTDMLMTIATDTGEPGAADDPQVTTLLVASENLDREGRDWLLQRINHNQLDAHLFYTIEAALDFVNRAIL